MSQSDRLKEVEREEEEVLKKELLLDYDPLNVDYNTDIDPTQLVSLGDRSDKSVYQLMDEDVEQEAQDVEKGEEDLEKDGKKGKKTGQNRSKPRSLKEKEPSNEK